MNSKREENEEEIKSLSYNGNSIIAITKSKIYDTSTNKTIDDVSTIKISMKQMRSMYNREYADFWKYNNDVYGVKPGGIYKLNTGRGSQTKTNMYDVSGYDRQTIINKNWYWGWTSAGLGYHKKAFKHFNMYISYFFIWNNHNKTRYYHDFVFARGSDCGLDSYHTAYWDKNIMEINSYRGTKGPMYISDDNKLKWYNYNVKSESRFKCRSVGKSGASDKIYQENGKNSDGAWFQYARNGWYAWI